jgi:undecaprenyl-diphosphatase
MAGSLIIGGVVMWIVDGAFGPRQRPGDVEAITFGQAVWIGLCQTLAAVFPGTSRSMATIAAGELASLSRATALEFSFLLSIPTMLAATGYDLLKFIKDPAEGSTHSPLGLDAHGIALLVIGFTVSFLVAWATVAWLMSWVRRRGFAPFAVYRIVAGAGILVWMAVTVQSF